MAYGVTSPVPGFDGGTFFILFNVYEDIIHAAKLSNIRKNLPVILFFVLGCGVGLFGISNLMMYLLTYHEMLMYASFAGLILGCTPLIYEKSALNLSKYKINFKNSIIFLVSLALMLLYAFWGTTPEAYEHAYYAHEAHVPLAWIFVASCISSVGMLIPGVGGAILMLILGIYPSYIEALATFNWAVILTLVAGMACGMSAGIRVIRKLLVNYPGELYCAILGFTVGSVIIVFPGFSASLLGILSLVCVVFFTIFAYLFSKKAK